MTFPRRIAIVGAGPAGTALALGLLRQEYDVTLLSERGAASIRAGSVMSSQITFESALDVETALGITELLPEAPAIESMRLTTRRADGSATRFCSPLTTPARSVDQRVRLPLLLEEIARLGGKVVVHAAGVDDLEELVRGHDLVVVSTGRGDLTSLFARDAARSPYSAPQRVAALTYLRPGEPTDDAPAFGYTCLEGEGECFSCPALSVDGPCDIVVVEGVPGGPLADWGDVSTPAQHLDRLRQVLAEHFPAESARFGHAELVDDHAVLRGRFTPVVRRPVGLLASGRAVLGMADAVVLNDPLTSQGANNAIKSASAYLDAITAHRGDFDVDWMERTFENFWRGWASWATTWTNSWLRPFLPHQHKVLDVATRHPAVAARIVAGFDDARLFSPWWFDPDAAEAFLDATLEAEGSRFDERELRWALGQFATGVTVVTTEDAQGNRWGRTANSFTSVSLNPPLVLWAAARSSPSTAAFAVAPRFAVNVLASDQHHLSRRFSTSGVDKFDGVPLAQRPPTGGPASSPPVLAGTVAAFVCRRTDVVEAGDHVVIFGEIESFRAPGGEPLVFHSGFYRLATRHPDL